MALLGIRSPSDRFAVEEDVLLLWEAEAAVLEKDLPVLQLLVGQDASLLLVLLLFGEVFARRFGNLALIV